MHWLEAVGGEVHGVGVGQFPEHEGGRGLACKESLRDEDMILRVPKEVLMTAENAKSLYPEERFERDEDAIVTMLIGELAAGPASKWAPYMRILAEVRVMTLKSMSDQEVEWLQDSELMSRARRSQEKMRFDFERLSPTLRRAARFGCAAAAVNTSSCPLNALAGFEAFSWARHIVDSRALTFRGRRVLAPVADMVNYAPLPGPRQYDAGSFFLKYHHLDQDGNLRTFADRDCSGPGYQFFEDYGDNPNLIYLEYHGFVPETPNPFECVHIDIPSLGQQADPLFRSRVTALRTLNERGPPSNCLRSTSLRSISIRRYAWALEQHSIESLETCIAFWQQQQASDTQQSVECPRDPPLARSTQGAQLLCTAIETATDRYPTTLAEDERILSKTNLSTLSPGALLALRYRMSQKRVLRALHSECDKILNRPLRLEPLSHRVALFNEWIQSQNWPVLKIEAAILATHGGRLGAVVSQGERVARGEAYLSVPIDTACMDAAAARRLIGTAVETLDDFHALLVLLLRETFAMIVDGKVRPERSYWGPYLLLLPGVDQVLDRVAAAAKARECMAGDECITSQTASLDNKTSKRDLPPLLWAENESEATEVARRWLRGSALEEALPRYLASVRRDWNQATVAFKTIPSLPLVFGDQDNILELILDFSTYRWAYQIIDSRAIWWAGGRHLVPMLDLVNAAATDEMPANAPVHRTSLDEQAANAVTYAATSFAPGEQLLEDYGQPNHVLFLYHGFVLPVNKHDCVRFDFEIPFRDDPTYIDSMRRRLVASRFSSPRYTACLKPGLFMSSGNANGVKDQERLTIERLFNFLAIKHDLDPPTRAGPSLQLILILADEIHSRLDAYSSSINVNDFPRAAKTLIDAEHNLLTELYDEIADQARQHEAFIRLRR